MAIAVITEDFVTKSGLIVQGTSTVTSSTGQTTALQVNGGAAIAKNLFVGTSARIVGMLTVDQSSIINGDLSVNGYIRLKATTATTLALYDLTTATIGGAGALTVRGGAYVGNNIVVASTASNTGTIFNNALYVAGGVGIAKTLVVAGTALFQSDVIFSGATTNVYSTNTVYTDNLIELHVPSTSTWELDDGKDIGIRFHYYANSASQNGALVLASDTKYLEWYNTGAESTTGTFTATTYGTFKTGNIIVASDINATTTQSGSLQVVGGIGVSQDIFVGGTITAPTFVGNLSGLASTASNIIGGTAGAIVYQSSEGVTTTLPIGDPGEILSSNGSIISWIPLSTVPVEYANTSTNIDGGSDMQIPYQTGTGQTEFEYNLRYDYTNNTLRTVNAVFTGTTNASSTISGALQVVGGAGIGQDLYVGGNISVSGGDITTNQTTFNLINTNATSVNIAGAGTAITIGAASSGYVSIRNTSAATTTTNGSLRVAGGVGIQGDVYIGGTSYIGNSIIPTSNTVSIGSQSNPIADLFLGPNSLYVDTVKLSAVGTTMNVVSTAGPVTITIGAGIFTNTTNASSTISGALQVVGGAGIGQDLYVGGDISVSGGDITTNQTTFNLINTNATSVNIAGAGTAITIGATSGYVSIRNTEAVSSAITGALRVAGGVGVSGGLVVAGTTTSTNLTVGDGTYGNIYLTQYASVFAAGGASVSNVVLQASANNLASGIGLFSNGGNNSLYSSGAINFITNRTLRDRDTPTGGNTFMSLSTSGVLTLSGNVESTATTNGTLIVTGGVGISSNLHVGGSVYVNNNEVITTATVGNFGVTSISAGTDTVISSATGAVTIWNNSTLQTITNRGANTTNIISITNTTAATSTITGALKVSGGAGIGGRLFVGDRITSISTLSSVSTTTGALVITGGAGIGENLYVGGSIYGTLIGTVTTATNVANGGPGQVLYQTNKGITGFVATGTSGQILISAGTSSPIFVNTSTFITGYAVNITGGSAGSLVYQTAPDTTSFITTGSVYVGAAVTATNIQGGDLGSLPYQTSTGTTTMLPLGSSGYLLTSNGSSPEWVGLGSLSAGTATNVSITNDVSSANLHYIAFLNTTTGASGVKTSGPSGLIYQPSTGYFGLGIPNPTVKLDVNGRIRISDSTAASSTITGALIVAGGVGIGGNLYVGGNTIGTDETSVNLLNTIATTVNFAGDGTTISIGANTGTTTINNNLTIGGNLTVQGTTTVVDSTVTNITDPIIILGGVTNNAPYITDTNQDKGVAFRWFSGSAKTGFFGYKDSTGAFTFIPDASISGEVVSGTKGALDANLFGGAANSIVYQSAANTTAFLAPATTSGYVLASTGVSSAPTWIRVATGDATTSTNIFGGSVGQIPFQTGTGVTSFFGPGTAGNVLVSAGTTSTGPVFQNTLTLAGTTAATNTTTGALQIKGGVGVGGSVYVSNRVGWTSATNISAVYQYYNAATNSLDTVFG